MARTQARQQDPAEVSELCQRLETALRAPKSKGKQFTCKKSTFKVSGTNDKYVDSWKFQDYDYKRSGLPTYARGLFTTKRKDGTPEIATRGYDKFFNIDEVNETRWRNIENNTRGPYELSVKENGCIIFISGLEDDTLLVCSKHSTGNRSDIEISHASAGEKWVQRHVATVNRTTKDLARVLRENNLTAVGELCDDSFEEHVLAYDEAAAGIYLHGLNFNVPEFATMPAEDVHRFADEWGFKKAKFEVYRDIYAVRQFLESCAETGTWDGRETEGFVVRCQMRANENMPYQDWFFKYKFEEPYLMYREWRECTKAVIAGKMPRIKKHQKITEEYIQFARRKFVANPSLMRAYNLNHGIISLREEFLQSRGMNGPEIIAKEAEEGRENAKEIVLVPVATLGCGKTTVALALAHLFGWGHVQNDNIPKQKDKPKKFAFEISRLLTEKQVVIADRNNHQRRERQQLMDDPKTHLLPQIREVTQKRVIDRGDNHQTIRAGLKDDREIMGIMEGFLNRFEGVDTSRKPDEGFSSVIDLDVCASSRENLENVVAALHSQYPEVVPNMPSPDDLDVAIDAAMNNYRVDIDLSYSYSQGNNKKEQKGDAAKPRTEKQNKKVKERTPEFLASKIEFFGIFVHASEIKLTLNALFDSSVSPEKSRLYNQLIGSRRIQPSFHVTLIHRASQADQANIWSHYKDQYIKALGNTPGANEAAATSPPTLGYARVRLERLVWDSRIMAFVVRILPANENEPDDGLPCANPIPHITIGTISPDVKPKESNDLLQRWARDGSGEHTGIFEAEVPAVKVITGSVGEVMSKGNW
ncbi:hypothetical protein N7470_007777 [Penicillium chermesinum]|nr:hypothetical protein N7470_007777 [Penicillium chermesinum]